MRIIKYLPAAVLIVFMAVSCKTTPDVKPTPPPETGTTQPKTNPNQNPPSRFDPGRVTEAYYTSTKSEVQRFIQSLNQIIAGNNYQAWRDSLSDEYFTTISSPENLREWSESPVLKSQKPPVVLRNAQDYFTHVVVKARTNVNVNDVDIDFITENRVRAFTARTNNRGEEQRVILYNLEKINNTWKIIN